MVLTRRQRASVTSEDDSVSHDEHGVDEQTQQRTIQPKSAVEVAKAESTFKKFFRRLITGCIMFIVLIFFLYGGPTYLMLMILLLQIFVFRELVNIRYSRYQLERRKSLDGTSSVQSYSGGLDIPLFRTLQVGWFLAALIFTYGDFVRKFAIENEEMAWMREYMFYNNICSFGLLSLLIVLSIVTLRPDSLRYQMGHLVWTMGVLLLVCGLVAKAPYMAHLGPFWFFFPAWLVINNDVWAYVCGMTLGKKILNRPFLPSLSPNKTWEGYIGAGVLTVIVAFYSSDFLSRFDWAICPSTSISFVYHPVETCEISDVFLVTDIPMPSFLVSVSGGLLSDTMALKPVQIHSLAIALFASTVAPFGGFLASAIKRANNAKDFDSVIPGHGGFTDRMDCQMLMCMFVWVYYKTFVDAYQSPAQIVLGDALRLPIEDRKMLYAELAKSFGL
eukprot:m.25116 g.25116  ORF g.25116 m.25116 type:complete len:445 (-) comp7679_c0_seq1:2121-3455(-)